MARRDRRPLDRRRARGRRLSAPAAWQELAFGPWYGHVYPHRDLAAARREVPLLRRLGARGRVLDLGCGGGRHVAALREAGERAFGVDRAPAMLARAEGRGTAGRLARADAARLPFRSGVFDAVVSLFSSLGHDDEGADHAALREAARVLREGGAVLLELLDPERLAGTLVPESARSERELVVHERRRWSAGSRRVEKDVRITSDGACVAVWRESVRLYADGELTTLLRRAGLCVVDVRHAGAWRHVVARRIPLG